MGDQVRGVWVEQAEMCAPPSAAAVPLPQVYHKGYFLTSFPSLFCEYRAGFVEKSSGGCGLSQFLQSPRASYSLASTHWAFIDSPSWTSPPRDWLHLPGKLALTSCLRCDTLSLLGFGHLVALWLQRRSSRKTHEFAICLAYFHCKVGNNALSSSYILKQKLEAKSLHWNHLNWIQFPAGSTDSAGAAMWT